MTSLPSAEEQVTIINNLLRTDKLRSDETAYAISLAWIKKWKAAVGFKGRIPTGDCPPIDNSDLLETDNKTIKESKLEKVDYSVFSQGIWQIFLSWYGGGPEIPVQIAYDRVKNQHVPVPRLTKLNLIYAGMTKTARVSKYKSVGEVKNLACELFQINPSDSVLLEGWKGTKGEVLAEAKTLAEVFINDNDSIIIGSSEKPTISDTPGLPRLYVNQLRHSKSAVGGLLTKYVPGMAGLTNFGNTCFLNSGLQCLLHTMPLVRFFNQPDWRDDLSPGNPLGTKCELANQFYAILKDSWCGSIQNIAPRAFLSSLCKHVPHFSPNMQQDVHELLTCLLDLIHEDLNRVQDKPSVESVTGDGTNDEVTAKLSWERHKQRNDSVIVDLFHGMLKSKLICPKCNNIVCVFDPYLSLALPVPPQEILSPKFTFVPYDPLQPKIIMQIPVQAGFQNESFKVRICSRMGRKFECMFALREGDNYQFITVLAKPQLNQSLYVFEVPTTENVIYCLVHLAANVKGVFKSTRIVESPYLLQLPDRNVHYDVMQKLIESRFMFLWEGELTGEIPDDFISLRKVMRTSKSLNKIDFEAKSPFSVQLCFTPDRSVPFISSRIITVVLNTNFCNSTDHFNWSRLKRETLTQSPSELKIEIPTLSSCFENFAQATTLDENNQWYCPSCKEFVCAEKKMDVWALPKCLVFQLKRFCVTGRSLRKVETPVDYPDEIDFREYVLGPQKNEPQRYKLYAVIQHFGQMTGGHYISNVFCVSNRQWISFNDSYVSEIRKEQAHQPGAYVLFYMKTE